MAGNDTMPPQTLLRDMRAAVFFHGGSWRFSPFKSCIDALQTAGRMTLAVFAESTFGICNVLTQKYWMPLSLFKGRRLRTERLIKRKHAGKISQAVTAEIHLRQLDHAAPGYRCHHRRQRPVRQAFHCDFYTRNMEQVTGGVLSQYRPILPPIKARWNASGGTILSTGPSDVVNADGAFRGRQRRQ